MSSSSSEITNADVAWARAVVFRICKGLGCHYEDEYLSRAMEELLAVSRKTGLSGSALRRECRSRIRYRIIDCIRKWCGRGKGHGCHKPEELVEHDVCRDTPLDAAIRKEAADARARQAQRLLRACHSPAERKAIKMLLNGRTLKQAGASVGKSEAWTYLLTRKMRVIFADERRRSRWAQS